MHIGRYLRKKRNELNLTQEQLAGLTDVDERTIRRIEKNDKPTGSKTIKTYSKIFDKLGVSTIERQRIISMINFDTDMNHLNPVGMLVKLSSKGPQDILERLDQNLKKAYELSKKGNYLDALDIYLAFAKIYPSEFVFLGCASIFEIIGEYDNAIEFSDKILSMETYHYEALYIKGTSLGSLNHHENSIEVLKSALQLKNTYQIQYNLGVVNLYKHNYKNAQNHFKECLKLNPYFAPAHLNLGISYFEFMCLDESLQHFNEAIHLDPTMYQAYARKGEHYRFIGQHDKAIRYFEECLKLDPKNYQALLGIAISFAIKEDLFNSSIHFTSLFNTHLNFFFKNGSENKKLIIDLGYEVINFIEFNYVNQDLIEVYINGICIPVNMNKQKNFIFIGSLPLSDGTSSMLYPMVGKIYEKEPEFKEVLAQIQKSVELFKYFEHPLYIDIKKEITVTITERENNVLIEIGFGGTYQIIGETNAKSEGFQSFKEHYEKYKELRIHLECPTEYFEITCIKNVSLHLLTK